MDRKIILILIFILGAAGLAAEENGHDEEYGLFQRLNLGVGTGLTSLTGDFEHTAGFSIPIHAGYFLLDFPVDSARGMVNAFALFEPGVAVAFVDDLGIGGVAWTMFSSWSIGADYWHRFSGPLDISLMGGLSLGRYTFSGQAARQIGPEQYEFTEIEDARSTGISPRIGLRFRDANFYLAYHLIGTPDAGLNPSYLSIGGSVMFLGGILTGK
ncbi:hypothetical protein [Spirochaeta dissipatitropha]